MKQKKSLINASFLVKDDVDLINRIQLGQQVDGKIAECEEGK